MNILIITTFFPPDTAISAVRPYMFAKYLTRLGHHVTVLRSGELNSSADHYFAALPGVRVISYLGPDSPAEAFQRGEIEAPSTESKSRIAFLPECVRFPIAKAYHALPIDFARKLLRTKKKAALQKAALEKLKGEHFDVVFATYGLLENIYAGQYAAELFHCKWILDLRDSIPQKVSNGIVELAVNKRIQDRAIQNADACTVVSNGLRESSREAGRKEIVTLYNGYEVTDALKTEAAPAPNMLAFCYTGQLYGEERSVEPLLQALSYLAEQGKISLDHILLKYAGADFHVLREQLSRLHMEQIAENHGYVSRSEAAAIQGSCDFFLTMAMNNTDYKGDLSGKFYEGIRCGRPIMALVAGNAPNSELYELNQQYRYGFCYEACRKEELFPQLCDYVLEAYTQKMATGHVPYAPSPELAARFRYDTLAKQLEGICLSLIEGH